MPTVNILLSRHILRIILYCQIDSFPDVFASKPSGRVKNAIYDVTLFFVERIILKVIHKRLVTVIPE